MPRDLSHVDRQSFPSVLLGQFVLSNIQIRRSAREINVSARVRIESDRSPGLLRGLSPTYFFSLTAMPARLTYGLTYFASAPQGVSECRPRLVRFTSRSHATPNSYQATA